MKRSSFIVAVCLLVGMCAAQELTPKKRSARDESWRATIRKQLHVPDELPELEAKTWSKFSPTTGVLAERVTYQTAAGMLVPAIVYRPDPKVLHWRGKLPGIVVVNGHGSDKYGWYAFYSGMMFARAGAMVVTYDPIGEGERNVERKSRAGSHDKTIEGVEGVDSDDWGRRLAGLMQVDLAQAVSYLRSRREVDPERIAVVGYSMGAFVAGIAGAIDPRIHAVLLSGGGVFDEAGPGYYDNNRLPCQGPPMRALRGLGDRAAVLYALNAERGPMLVMNGSDDTVMKMEEHPPEWFAAVRQRAVKLNGSERNIFESIMYPGVSHRTSWVNKDGVQWLHKQIRFAIWTDKDIAAALVTHISEWAKANSVDITPNYMREDREGGLQAVGTGLPGIRREELSVLPNAEWIALKDRFTYEAWAEKTRAAQKAMTR